MLGWAIAFLAVTVVAAAFGFGGLLTASAGAAQTLFFLFLVVFVLALVARLSGRPNR